MTSSLVSTINVDFANANVAGDLQLTNFDSYVGQGWAALKLVDTIKVGTLQLFTDVGKVEFYSDSSEQVDSSIELVQNVDKVDAPYGESISFLWAVSPEGEIVTPTLVLKDGAYKVTPKCSGILKRSNYVRPFKILRYAPQIKTAGLSFSIHYGVVAAVKSGKVSMVQVEAIAGLDDTTLEAYRIVSEVLVNEEGEWEKPDGWPSTPTYPGGVTPVPDPAIGVIVERVHETCHLTSKVTSYVRKYSINYSKPYSGSSTYKPKKTMREGNLSGMTTDQKIRASEAIAERKKSAL